MPVVIIGTIEDVKTYEGKNGFGANVTISAKIERRTKRLEFRVTDPLVASKLEERLDTEVTIRIELEQSNFGIRFGQLLEVA